MYTVINALIVTNDASYIATQIHGVTEAAAWRDAFKWAANHGEEKRVSAKSPVFFNNACDHKAVIQRHTIGSCARLVKRAAAIITK